MKLCTRALTFVFLVAVLVGCVTTSPYELFVLSRSDIHERVDTVAMLPLEVDDFDRKEEVSARYEALITEHLEKAGFKVIPSREYTDIRESLTDQYGDLYDPETGEAYQEKLDAIWRNSLLLLAEKFNPDAYMSPAIVRVGAHWQQNETRWDGVKRPTAGETEGFWEAFLVTPGQNQYGTTSAMSLEIDLFSMGGELYYVGRGGIQLLSEFRSQAFGPVPESDWFVNEDWNVEAVSLAVKALTEGTESASTAISLSADISIPHTIKKVWYRPTIEKPGAFWVMSDTGTLTVNDSSLEFAGKKENLSILLSEVQKVSYGHIAPDGFNKWVVIEYGETEPPSLAVMAPARTALTKGSDEIFSTITYIIKTNNLKVPINPL